MHLGGPCVHPLACCSLAALTVRAEQLRPVSYRIQSATVIGDVIGWLAHVESSCGGAFAERSSMLLKVSVG